MNSIVLRFLRNGLIGLSWLALLGVFVPSVRADHIDRELFKKALLVMKDLEDKGYKNVGVLKFQVKVGSGPMTLAAGQLNYVMATRLENALISKVNEKAPIGITRGASAAAAAKDGNATFLTKEGRQKLFENKYPLAWGTESVNVNAFLTGTVALSPDMKQTTVTIQVFDKDNLDLRDILSFTTKTDSAILRDTNQNFVVARRAASWATSDNPDEALDDLAIQNAQTQIEPKASRKLLLDEVARDYLDIKIRFDGQPAEITPDGFLNKPAAGQTVAIFLTAKVKLGLLLRVNGVNTLDDQRDEKADLNDYKWWVLEADKEYAIQGFYSKGQRFAFKAKANSDVPVTAMGQNSERHGKIDFDIFVEPKSVTVEASVPKTRKPEFSFRTLNTRADSLDQAKEQVQASMVPLKRPVMRTFITKDLTGEDQVLETTTFDGRHVGGISINYRRDAVKND